MTHRDGRPDEEYAVRPVVDDVELTALHHAAFGGGASEGAIAWRDRLERNSIAWVTARRAGVLVGFVNVIGDGGAHAVVLDTCVHPDVQGCGIGRRLVEVAAAEAARLGCEWLHADYEDRHAAFYEQACGLRPTRAGLLRLSSPDIGDSGPIEG